MKRIALVTSKQWYRQSREDLFLENHLLCAGLDSQIVCWTDPIPWEEFDLVILRSTWDYHLSYTSFCCWLDEMMQRGVVMANGADRIKRNINKTTQLLDCSGGSIQTLPFRIVSSVNHALLEAEKFGKRIVIKPSVSASGYHTFLIDRNEDNWRDELIVAANQILCGADQIVIQPFMPSIAEGELSLIYFGGKLSHGVWRFPGIFAEKRKAVPCLDIPLAFAEVGKQAVNTFGGSQLLYARVDLINQGGKIYVMEIELAEPDLYLSLDYPSDSKPVQRFIDEIDKHY